MLLCITVSSATIKVEDIVKEILKNKDSYKTILDSRHSKKAVIRNDQIILDVFEGKVPNDKYYGFLGTYLQEFGSYSVERKRKIINNMPIIDSLYIVTISKFLYLDKTTYDNVINSAVDHLIDDTPFDLIYALTDSIKPYVKSLPDNSDKFYLLSFLKLTSNEREEILNNKYALSVPLAVKVRFGDQEAEKQLIEQYNNEKKYKYKERLASELIKSGTENCLKNLIVHFNEPIFEVRQGCISESIRYPIIKGLKRHYPYDSLFTRELLKVDSVYLPKPEIVTPYLEKFKTWAYDTYKVKPIDPDPKPILFWYCTIQ